MSAPKAVSKSPAESIGSAKDDDKDTTGASRPQLTARTLSGGEQDVQPPAYTGKRSWYRSTFTQATILGICSFCAPGLWGAMSSLGAGGQNSPSVSYQVVVG